MGYARRNFMVPVPRFATWDAFNAHLEARCRERRERKLRGHTETIGERFERDLAALLPLPEVPYEACEKVSARVSSLPWCATRATTTRCQRGMNICRCWRAARSMRWPSPAAVR